MFHNIVKELKKRFFNKDYDTSQMTISKFFKDKFSLVIDLRTIEDKNVFGSGKKLVNTQNGVLLEIVKKAMSANVLCKIFVISDSLVNFKNKVIENVYY